MKTTLMAALCAGAMAVAFAVPTQAQAEITVTHAQGETTVAEVPSNIVVFDLAALEVLDALGVEVAGVPEFPMPETLAHYNDAPKMGSLFEPDYEAVNAAAPDLIIVAGRSSRAYSELANIAPTIDVTNSWEGFEASVIQNARVLGEITGKSAEIDEMIAEFEAVKAATQAATADAGTALIILTSAGEITAYGVDSRFGWIHETAGFTPAIEDVEAATHGDAISFEFILETNPDWMLVIDRDAAIGSDAGAAEQVLNNELIAQTTAWSKGQVIYVDPIRSYIVNGGLTALTDLVQSIQDGVTTR